MNRRSSPIGPPSATSVQAPAAEGPSFEAAIKRLTEIVQVLERGELALEESLRLFEEGVRLSRISQERLDGAERRVEQLLAVDEQGRARTAPFATDASDEGVPDDDGPPF
jgi:exodeoxyribonuclease VII small subunit